MKFGKPLMPVGFVWGEDSIGEEFYRYNLEDKQKYGEAIHLSSDFGGSRSGKQQAYHFIKSREEEWTSVGPHFAPVCKVQDENGEGLCYRVEFF